MSHKNYSKHFKNNNDKHFVNPELEETVLAAGGEVMRVEQPEMVNPEEVLTPEEVADLKEEEVATVNEKADLIGIVTGCTKLYVRTEPNKESKPLCIIDQNTEVVINEKSTEDFYKVCTSAGVEGYCMKKFISIK